MFNKALLACVILGLSNLCFAQSFQLTVDNQTSDLFRVQTTDNAYCADLKPYELGVSYTTNWVENSSDVKSFSFRFISVLGSGYEVYVTGIYQEEMPRVFCKSGTTHYQCQLTNYNDSAAKLSITTTELK